MEISWLVLRPYKSLIYKQTRQNKDVITHRIFMVCNRSGLQKICHPDDLI